MTQSLQNQNALIVGGGTGIGRAIAEALAREGCRTAVSGRRQEKLESVGQQYDGPGEIVWRVADVAQRASVNDLVAWYQETVGAVDILIHAAGVNIKDRSMSAMPPEKWDEVMAINATGAYNSLAAVLPTMRERKRGTIVLINSISGRRALDIGGVAYCAAKFAMSALGTAVGREDAANGIRVTNVYPGEVDTPLLEQRATPVSDEHRARILKPQDVAEIVVAICRLPDRAHVPEITIKPRLQEFC